MTLLESTIVRVRLELVSVALVDELPSTKTGAASLRATCSEPSVPAPVVTLGSGQMVDELHVAGNGVASLGPPFVNYYNPHPSPSSQACAEGSIAPVSESSVEFHLSIELVSLESPLWSMLPRC